SSRSVCWLRALAAGPRRVPYTTLFRSLGVRSEEVRERALVRTVRAFASVQFDERKQSVVAPKFGGWIEKLLVNATGDDQQLLDRSEEHTSELQSLRHLVCRLLLEKKKN